MITRKDLYSGSLGKLKNAGGSKMYTIPHTVSIPPEYTITLPTDITGDCVTSSLDGRLWLFRNAEALSVASLKWDTAAGKLKFAETQTFNNIDDVPLARGLDWVLTNNNIFMISENSDILSSSLFDANIPDTFLYSVLRNKNIDGSGKDPLTNQAWGMREDNGNSEGTGVFSKNTHLLYPAGTHSFDQCYSLLPAVGDWQIMENFLVRRPDNPLDKSYNHMLSLRPLIPLEILRGNSSFGTGYNFEHRGIHLAYFDGQLWAKGLYYIGRVFILPAVFDVNGEPLEFYLYISTEYPCSPFLSTRLNANNDWLKMAVAHLGGDTLYGFLSEQADALSSGTCLASPEAKIFSPLSREWLNISENDGRMFVDTSNSSALVLHDNGADFLLNVADSVQTFECSTLPQWIAPAGSVDAVNPDFVIAHDDVASFLTSLNTGFNRQCFSHCLLPLSRCSFQNAHGDNYKFAVRDSSVSNNKKILGVNQVFSIPDVPHHINWQDIYKNPIEIQYINSAEVPFKYGQMQTRYGFADDNGSIYCTNINIDDSIIVQDSIIYPIFFCNDIIKYRLKIWLDDETVVLSEEEYDAEDIPSGFEFLYYATSASQRCFYVDLEQGTLSYFSLSFDIPQNPADYYYCYHIGPFYTDNNIGVAFEYYRDRLYDYQPYETVFSTLMDIPAQLKGKGNQWAYFHGKDKTYTAPSIFLTNCVEDKNDSRYSFAVFREQTANTIFTLRFLSGLKGTLYTLNYPDDGEFFIDSNGNKRSIKNYHVAYFHDTASEKNIFYVFHSRLHTEIFDFKQELERSNLA